VLMKPLRLKRARRSCASCRDSSRHERQVSARRKKSDENKEMVYTLSDLAKAESGSHALLQNLTKQNVGVNIGVTYVQLNSIVPSSER
jgi:hypothetical protein